MDRYDTIDRHDTYGSVWHSTANSTPLLVGEVDSISLNKEIDCEVLGMPNVIALDHRKKEANAPVVSSLAKLRVLLEEVAS
ncbi:unnamed protein product [Dovyalis caffra]|uniref:Uncharacterized protein n=1 Tax=Dovyalis caffra TaxID=77055 RepID=A0AAV1SML6_9ROSI|nr:unnamed protein product [Dovyalis caffra]